MKKKNKNSRGLRSIDIPYPTRWNKPNSFFMRKTTKLIEDNLSLKKYFNKTFIENLNNLLVNLVYKKNNIYLCTLVVSNSILNRCSR